MQIRRRRGAPETGPVDAVDPPRGAGEHVGESRGGYRLVRLLGAGRRASVYLGHPDIERAEQNDSAGADAPRGNPDAATAAVKIFHSAVPDASIDAEIEALSRCGHPHTVRLLDVASGPDGRPCLVLERLAGGSLSGIVAERESIRSGEAVTILVPLLDAVDAMHAGGVAHGGLRLSSVLFRPSGAPVIVGFGSATLIPEAQSEAALAADPLVGTDRAALGTLARAVLARVPGDDAQRLVESLADGAAVIEPETLFEFADPAPVRLTGPASDTGAAGSVGARAVATQRVGEERAVAVHRAQRGEGEARRSVQRARLWLTHQARLVRPRFWMLGGAVAASIVAALVLVPPETTVEQSDRGGGSVAAEEATAPDPAEAPDGRGSPDVPGTQDPGESAHDPVPDDPVPPDEPVVSDDPVLSDDPVAALGALLAERERCVRDLSVLCLDGVLQSGSAAMERDAAIIRSIQEGGEVPPGATIVVGELALVERLGDSALVSLNPAGVPVSGEAPGHSEPASSLMMRGEAGWRIRDYL